MKFIYEGCSKSACIYEIINTHNNRRYVGRTKHAENRWSRGHAQSLKRGVHKNKYLQADFDKCFKELGHTNFLEFHILEAMPKATAERMSKRELYWMKKHKKQYELYNLTEECKGTHSISKETRKLISDKKKEFYKTDEGKALIKRLAEEKKGKTYEELYGEEKSNKVKESIKQNKLIEMNKKEVKENLSKQLSGKTFEQRFGSIERAQEIKNKMSLGRKGTNFLKPKEYKNIELISPEGIIYKEVIGIKEFALLHNLSKNHLCELLLRKRKSHKGWRMI